MAQQGNNKRGNSRREWLERPTKALLNRWEQNAINNQHNMSEKLIDYRGQTRLILQVGVDGIPTHPKYEALHQTGFSTAVPLAPEDSMVFFVLLGRPKPGHNRFVTIPAKLVEELTILEAFDGFKEGGPI